MEQILYPDTNNAVYLCGELIELPVFSHENHGKVFDKFSLSVERLSGARDDVVILAERSLLSELDPTQGSMIQVEGQLRSYNNRSGEGRRLVISVYAQTVNICEGEPDNTVFLRGSICREPVLRRTPLGREICDIMLAVERKYYRRDYLPCILWGSVARMGAELEKGELLELSGRLQSRLYVKQTEDGPEERVAYEVSAITAQPVF